jgi:hypothetical protein
MIKFLKSEGSKSIGNININSERTQNLFTMASNLSEANYSKNGTDKLNFNDSSENKNTFYSNDSKNKNLKVISTNHFNNIYPSPNKSNKSILKPLKKQSSQKIMFFTSYKNNENGNSRNINNFQKSFSSQKIINNPIQKNGKKPSSLKSGINIITLKKTLNNNKSLFNVNNIKSRNSKMLESDLTKFSSLFKSEGGEKSETNLTTERNKKEMLLMKMNRRSSVNTNFILNKNVMNSRKNYNRRTKTITYPKNAEIINLMKKKINLNKVITPAMSNPLLISEEDKIFDEMKEYLFYKYEQKAKLKELKKKNEKLKFHSPKLTKKKFKLQTDDKIKLNYLYSRNTKINKEIRYAQRKKDMQDLDEYQNNLLDVVKPYVSDSSYDRLKKRLIDIRKKNSKKYQNNYKKIKEIENKEEEIINDFNKTCSKCLKILSKARAKKEIIHACNLKINLPLLHFISCLKNKKKAYKTKIKI